MNFPFYELDNKVLLCHNNMSLGNSIGDVCEGDMDGDNVLDNDDHCPKNPRIQGTDFHNYIIVDLLPGGNQSQWLLSDNGAEIRQVADIDHPVMLIGEYVHRSHWFRYL